MSLFRLQIKAPNRTVWRDSATLETRNLGEAVRIADKIALACERTAAVHQAVTRTWVVEVVGERDDIFHRVPVACA